MAWMSLLGLALALAFAGACGTKKDVPASAYVRPAPAWDEIKKATYYGLQLSSAPVTLTDGVWEQVRAKVSVARDFQVTGDLDGDGSQEAVVILSETGGGTGSFNYIAVVGYKNDRLTNLATVPLGDRVQIRSVQLGPKRVEAEVVQAAPGDPACCPGDLVRRSWSFDEAGLQELPPGEPKRFGLEALEGTQWTLQGWDVDLPVAKTEQPISLTIVDRTISGYTGCNNYSVTVKPGMLGQLEMGVPATSRMACLPELAEIERQFVEALGRVEKMSFLNGRLALTYIDGQQPKTLLFDPLRS